MAIKYKKHSSGGSFERQDFGDFGLRSYKEQQNQIIEALKLERLRSEQYGDEYATGLRGVAANEQENRDQLKQLQQKEYRTRLDAVEVRGDREVDAILGQAKLAGNKKDFWLNFSTTYSKEWGKLAGGLREYADARFAQELSKDPDYIKKKQAYLSLEEGAFDLLGKKIDKSTGQIIEADIANANNAQHLNNSWNQGKTEVYNFKEELDQFHTVYEQRAGESYGADGADIYVRDYLKTLGIDPDSKYGTEIRGLFRRKVTGVTNKGIDLDTARKHERFLEAYLEAFQANPDYRNWHRLVQHVRTMYNVDEKGNVLKPEGNRKRNAAQSWIRSVELYTTFAGNTNPIRNNWQELRKQVVDIPILPEDGTGKESKVLFSEKFPLRLEGELLPKWLKIKDDRVAAEKSLVKSKTYDVPLAGINREVTELGKEATILDWSEGGWIEKTRSAVYSNGNKDLIKSFHDLVGYDPAKHVNFSAHSEFMEVALDPTKEGSDRALYLFSRIPSTKVGNYSNIPQIAENVQQFHASGVFTNTQMKSFATDLVKVKANKTYNIETGGFTPNARLTVQKIEEYRHMVFNKLNKDDFKSAEDRMLEAQRLTEIEFDRGLPKSNTAGDTGTGFFKATVPAADEAIAGQMTVVWDGWDNKIESNEVYSYTDMTEMFSKKGGSQPVTDLIKSGKIITRDTATGIVSDIIEGNWDGKIPQNVQNFAALKGWDQKYAMNYMLKTLGYDTQIPVDSYDQLRAAGFTVNIPNPSKRHTSALMMWRSYVKQLGYFPLAGPGGEGSRISNPDYELYQQNNVLVEKLINGETGYFVRDKGTHQNISLAEERRADKAIKANEKTLNKPYIESYPREERKK